MIRNLPQKDEGRHALHLLAAELDNHLPRRVGTGEPAHLPTCSRLVAGRPPHQGTPGIRTGTRKGLGLRCFAAMRRRSAHAHRSLAEYQRLPAPTRSRRAEESERRSVPHNRQPLQPQEPTYPAMAGEASASEANLHSSRGVLAQPPRSVVAIISTRSIGSTELCRCGGDRAGHEGSYQATQPSSKTLGVGSSAETAEAPEAHFCVPYLRNGALERFSQRLQRQVVSAVREETADVLWGNRVEGVAGRLYEGLPPPSPYLPQDALQLREGLLDGVEVRRVGRKEHKLASGLLDEPFDA